MALFASPATGQEAVQSEGGIADIVVTALKRSESAQAVPASVSVLGDSQLDKLKIDNSAQIAAQIPNVQVQMPYGETQPVYAIRGIAATDYSPIQHSPIAMYQDEVYRGVPALQATPLYDIERIEVLRGPQGTLYGKNTTGGAVNFITKRPNLNDASGYLTIGAGDYDRIEAKGAVEAPIIADRLAIRAAFYGQKVDGYVRNRNSNGVDQSSIDDRSGRITLLAKPSDDLELLLRLQHTRGNGSGPGSGQRNIGPDGIGFSGVTNDDLGFWETRSEFGGSNRLRNSLASLTLNWDVSADVAVTSISSYQTGSWEVREDADGTPLNVSTNRYASNVKQWAQELRVSNDDINRFSWIAGIYASGERIRATLDYRFLYNLAGDNLFPNGVNDCFDDFLTGCRLVNNLNQERKSYAGFLHTTFDISERLNLTAGARYTREKAVMRRYSADIYYFDPAVDQEFLAFNTIPGDGSPSLPRQSNVDAKWGGSLGLNYTIEAGKMLYATFSTAFRSGAYNGQAFYAPGEVNYVKPERLNSYEIGFKTSFLNNALRLNGAVFHYDYRNQQFIDVNSTSFLQTLVNAPKSRIRGAELEISARPVDPLIFNIGIGYLDAKYKELVLRGIDYAGNQMITAPNWKVNGSVDWTFLEEPVGDFALHFDAVYTGRQYYDAPNTSNIAQRGYGLVNGRLSFDAAGDSFSAGIWVRNITNRKYYSYGYAEQAIVGFDYVQRGMPRMWGADLTIRF